MLTGRKLSSAIKVRPFSPSHYHKGHASDSQAQPPDKRIMQSMGTSCKVSTRLGGWDIAASSMRLYGYTLPVHFSPYVTVGRPPNCHAIKASSRLCYLHTRVFLF